MQGAMCKDQTQALRSSSRLRRRWRTRVGGDVSSHLPLAEDSSCCAWWTPLSEPSVYGDRIKLVSLCDTL